MPRSRRRRQRDRRQEAEQRLAARKVFQETRDAEHQKLGRYIRAIFRNRAGEIVTTKDGREYKVQDDGSLRKWIAPSIVSQEG